MVLRGHSPLLWDVRVCVLGVEFELRFQFAHCCHDVEGDGMMAQDMLAVDMQIKRYRQVDPTGQEMIV